MNSTDVKDLLDLLADLYAQRDLVAVDRQAAINSVIPPEVKALLADIDAEFAGKTETVNAKIAELEVGIGELVKRGGKSVKGSVLQAVFFHGRISWDTKELDDLAEMMPELLQHRKQGQPYVSIKAVGR
jgi:hypothetical protein